VASVKHKPTPKREAVQAAVLQATEGLLRDGASYADLNIERIATRAGISRTAFYFYFRDKRDLLMRLTEEVSRQLYAEADRWYSGSGDPAADIRAGFVNIARLYSEHTVLLRTVVEVSTYDHDFARFWRAIMARFIDATRARIEAEQVAGRAPAMSARATAFALVWMAERSFYQLLEQADPFARDELVDALVGIWIRAVYGR
jgi:AcrR family transcriptional regulator